MNTNYLMPTKILMGEDCIRSNALELAGLGRKALIVTGKNSAKRNGSLDDVLFSLDKNGQHYALYDQVMSNPTIACVYEGAAVARREQVDFVIGIGGGSAMDAAKVIALLARQDIPREELLSKVHKPDALPLAMVPTTAGTGSEVTPYAILTNDIAQTKTPIGSLALFPRCALLDAGYMAELPPGTTLNTALDALSHAVEGMLSVRANPMTDLLAGESIRQIASCFEVLHLGVLEPQHRRALLYGSVLAGMVIANTGTTAVHSMGHLLTYFRGIAHGGANGLLLPAFIRRVQGGMPERMANIWPLTGFPGIDQFSSALAGLLGEREELSEEEIEKFSAAAIRAKNVRNCPVVLSYEDIAAIYRESFACQDGNLKEIC